MVHNFLDKCIGDANEHEFFAQFLYILKFDYNIFLTRCSEINVNFWIFTKCFTFNQRSMSIVHATTGQLEEFFDVYFSGIMIQLNFVLQNNRN